MTKSKKSDVDDNVVIQPNEEQLMVLIATKSGPTHEQFLNESAKRILGELEAGGLVKRLEEKARSRHGTAPVSVFRWAITERGLHVLKALLVAPGDLEQLIAEAERWNPGGAIDIDGDFAKHVITLYALLLRRFIMRGKVTDLHVQAQFALDRFGT